MRNVTLLALAATTAGLTAQANTVPGLDGRLTAVDDLTYYGRRGAAHPNGEVGMAMLNEMCNPGSVTIPWYAAMQSNHPKFGFLIARESGGRMVQISDWSYCKHAFTSTNYGGSGCGGSCQNPSTGSVMGISCFDTYGSGNNADRTWLGPPQEIDPWLGTWNPVGSYFDVGDPQTGIGPADGVRSLNTSGFDNVKNRVTVREQDLLVAGARYFYGIHLIHQGEAVGNRGDNLASRGFNPSYGGGSWSFANNATGQSYGSILGNWTNATLETGGNGSDDGRYAVAVVVTPLGGGQYHYEYAVHNVDANRGAASFRVPILASGTAGNFGFRDIDGDPLNDWTATRVGNELVWSATPNNPQNWNTLYNFWFDCDVPPGNGQVLLDQARIGPGALTVAVGARVPDGQPAASVATYGNGCGGSQCDTAFYEFFASPAAFDLNGGGLSMDLVGNRYQVGAATATWIAPAGSTLLLGDDADTTVALPFALPYPGGSTNQVVVCSNGFLSPAGAGTSYTPGVGELLSGAMRWVPFWRDLNPSAGGQVRFDANATRAVVTYSGVVNYGTSTPNTFQVQFEPSGKVSYLWQSCALTGGQPLVGFSRGGSNDPGNRDLSATLGAGFAVCANAISSLSFQVSPAPVLGTTVQLQTSNIPPGTLLGAHLISLQQANPPIDLTPQGAPGCFGYVSGGATLLYFPTGSNHAAPYSISSSTAFLGLPLFLQSLTLSPGVNQLGVAASNGVALTLGI